MPVFCSELMDCCREATAALQLLANGSILCQNETAVDHPGKSAVTTLGDAADVTPTCLKWIQWPWS